MMGKKPIKIMNIVLSLILGGVLVLGGISKFGSGVSEEDKKTEETAKVEPPANGATEGKEHEAAEAKIKNFFDGIIGTGYFWQFLAVCELVCGLLILSQVFQFLGAVMALPIILNIVLFHLFLEPHEVGELIQVLVFLSINIWLIAYEYPNWKHLFYKKFSLND